LPFSHEPLLHDKLSHSLGAIRANAILYCHAAV
jgi:hypothetical protein